MAGGNVILIHSKKEWIAALENAKAKKQFVIVDFTATWCGPCRMIAPVFEELSTQFPTLVFLKVDVDEVEDVAAECAIRAMPTFQVFKNGEKVDEMVGASKAQLQAIAKKYEAAPAV